MSVYETVRHIVSVFKLDWEEEEEAEDWKRDRIWAEMILLPFGSSGPGIME
jgi:hypothetical protein